MSRMDQIAAKIDADLADRRQRLQDEQERVTAWKNLPKVERIERYIATVAARLQAMQKNESLPAESITQSIHEYQVVDDMRDAVLDDPYIRLFSYNQENNFEELLENLIDVAGELEAALQTEIPGVLARF